MPSRPLDILHAALNQPVTVELRGGRTYRGTLDGYDHPHLNLVVKNVEEVAEGGGVRKYDHVLVRGDAIIYIRP